MAIIPFVEREVFFRTDQGAVLRFSRPYLVVEFVDDTGKDQQASAMYDSGAPLCVLPHSIWHDRKISWQPLSNKLFRDGKPDPAALTWQGGPCQLGETQVRLVDRALGVRSGPLRFRGKFPVGKVASHLETEIILGQDILLSNSTTLTLRGGHGQWAGVMLVD